MPIECAAEVFRIVAAELAVPESYISLDKRIVDDLGLDSLAAVRLLSAVEERFGVELVSTSYVHMETVGDVVRFVDERLATELGAPR
jgi:acyl carrier protein